MANRMVSVLALGIVAALNISAAEQPKTLCEGFLPPNTMKVPVGSSVPFGFKSVAGSPGGISEATFNEVIDRAEKIYAPVVAQKGGTLKTNRLWDDDTVNASAQQMGGSWILNMYGGLARHEATTFEGFALVICHELGHHLGGAPKIKSFFGQAQWATNEGGADYFANLKCLRNFFAEDDNAKIIADAKASGRLDAFAENLCTKQFAKTEDQLLCMRGSLGGTSVAGLFQALRQEKNPPDFSKPDTSRVTKTNDQHPATQCRMDTYLAGSVCAVDVTVANSDKDVKQGSCVEGVDSVGFRPRCWFAP